MKFEKQIEDLAEAIYKSGVAIEGTDIAFGLYDTDTHFHLMAAKLYNAGYGNVKAAEHRAEVAEKALERTVVELLITQGYSALMAVIRAEEFFIPEAIKEAEKELLEENKNA